MTNTVAILTLVTTNWVNIAGDSRIEGGTNYAHQRQVISTNLIVEEVTLCTNRTFYKKWESPADTAPTRWEPIPMPPLPPLPR